MVPIPVISGEVEVTEAKSRNSLEVDAWIIPPVDGGESYWICESKITDTYGLFYYSSLPCVGDNREENDDVEGSNVTMMEKIGDVLYVKMQHGEVVDVTPEEVCEVAKKIAELFRD